MNEYIPIQLWFVKMESYLRTGLYHIWRKVNIISQLQPETKIQSMPKIQTPWRYSFFVDVTFDNMEHYFKAKSIIDSRFDCAIFESTKIANFDEQTLFSHQNDCF